MSRARRTFASTSHGRRRRRTRNTFLARDARANGSLSLAARDAKVAPVISEALTARAEQKAGQDSTLEVSDDEIRAAKRLRFTCELAHEPQRSLRRNPPAARAAPSAS